MGPLLHEIEGPQALPRAADPEPLGPFGAGTAEPSAPRALRCPMPQDTAAPSTGTVERKENALRTRGAGYEGPSAPWH